VPCIVLLMLAPVIAGAFFGCFYSVLGPLHVAAKDRRFARQFSLADLLCLFVVMQLPFGTVHWMAQGNQDLMGEVIVDSLIGVAVATLWCSYVGTLSRAGIEVVWHRCAVLCVAMPIAVVGGFAMVLIPIAAFIVLTSGDRSIGYWLILAEVLLAGVLYGLGRFTRFIVAAAEASRRESPPVPGNPESGGPSPPSLSG
jgi:hypothetical protein